MTGVYVSLLNIPGYIEGVCSLIILEACYDKSKVEIGINRLPAILRRNTFVPGPLTDSIFVLSLVL